MRLDEIPEVPGGDVFGHAKMFDADRRELFRRVRDTGPLSRTRFLHRDVVWTNTPAAAHALLVERARSFEKSPGLRLLLWYLAGDGLFTAEGELWRRQRRLMAPLFQPSAMAAYAQCMNDVAERAVDRWSDGQRVDLAREMTRVTMGVVGKALFDSDTFDEADALGEALTVALEWSDRNSGSGRLVAQIMLVEGVAALEGKLPSPLERLRAAAAERLKEPVLLPGAFDPELRAAIRRVDDRVAQMISERRAQGLTRNDLLTRILAARDEENGAGPMTDKQVRDEANTLFVAGHETTATALAWCFYLLARHPEVKERVQAEVDALPPGAITFERAMRLPLTARVFKEAMRLYPPVPVYARRSVEDVTIEGYEIPAGTLVFCGPSCVHRDPVAWPEPERFDPDRFLPDVEAKRPKSAWIPFGAGPRVCIGNHFAMLEGPIVLAAVMRAAEVTVDPTREIVPGNFATLRPEGGVPATVRRRAGVPAGNSLRPA